MHVGGDPHHPGADYSHGHTHTGDTTISVDNRWLYR